MTPIWVDTSFLYALFAASDQNHKRANIVWKPYCMRPFALATSGFVISELGTLLAYRFSHTTALRTVSMVLESTVLQRIFPDEECISSSLRWWKAFSDKKFSLVDCISFEFMRRLGIKKALSFDNDFVLAGYQIIDYSDPISD